MSNEAESEQILFPWSPGHPFRAAYLVQNIKWEEKQKVRLRIAYVELLLRDIETLLTHEQPETVEFQRLFAHLLASDTDGTRAVQLQDELCLGRGTLVRYACRVSAPHPIARPSMLRTVKKLLAVELATAHAQEAELKRFSKEEAERRLAEAGDSLTNHSGRIRAHVTQCAPRLRAALDGTDTPLATQVLREFLEWSRFFLHFDPLRDEVSKHLEALRTLLPAENGEMVSPSASYAQALRELLDSLERT